MADEKNTGFFLTLRIKPYLWADKTTQSLTKQNRKWPKRIKRNENKYLKTKALAIIRIQNKSVGNSWFEKSDKSNFTEAISSVASYKVDAHTD